ncbi:PIF1-like helicase-domain-containing protein [Infundibulicybe gibba]|nr:PIF1-like helicase-domain-containing protein [Infundibulicybe gibba]
MWENIPRNFILAEQLNYNHQELAAIVDERQNLFNEEQKNVFESAMSSVNNNEGKLLFIHSAGGGGKTFVCNTIAAAVRSQGHVALCVASSGIAALLLEGGRTAHSRFKIPIPVNEVSISNIKHGTLMHEVLEHTKM